MLLEGLIVALAGLLVALAANQVSRRGLVLTYDYFPPPPPLTNPPVPLTNAPAAATTVLASNRATVGSTATNTLAERLQARGLGLIESNQVFQLFEDSRRAPDVILFVDARDDHLYQEGHIPGAWQLDRYYPQNYLPALLPVCKTAASIVVYCTGGDCEDSEFAAELLRQAGLPPGSLLVYAGGFEEWSAQGRPIETGARNSGTLRNSRP